MQAMAPTDAPTPMTLVVVDVQKGDEDGDTPGIPITSAAAPQRTRASSSSSRARAPPRRARRLHPGGPQAARSSTSGASSTAPRARTASRATTATELADGLEPRPDEFLIRKRRYSAFFATELDLVLRSYGRGR